MKRLTLALLFLVSGPVIASHIVGGEIELLHKKDFKYQLNLIYYFDVINSQTPPPEDFEPQITLFFYRKSDNVFMASFTIGLKSKKRVPYTQPGCSSNELVTDKIFYSDEVQLPPDLYSDPAGYYVIWPRCCRNYTITNIFSDNPTHGQTIAGQTFYLEFPPVTVNGQPFVNSSPKNFPALADYACPTKPYYVDFAGIDDDGDSLIYSLVNPISTTSGLANPDPSPAPYPDVVWRPGFDAFHAINRNPATPGFPDLTINKDGLIRATPKAQGLYVFAVKVEEYRNNTKIGETRRDFQMLVTDCRLSAPPEISGKKVSAPTFTPGEISVQFDNTVSDQDRCIIVSISDVDATREADNKEEVINLKIVSLNFKKNLNSLLPSQSAGVIHDSGTIEFKICLPACPFFLGGPAQIGIIAFDDACALPLTDTLKVNIEIEPPHNERAKFNDISPDPPDELTATLDEGDQQSWPFEAHDAEGDELVFFALSQGFSLSASGMTTDITENGSGTLKGDLTWDAFCDIHDFTKRTSFLLKLLVDDVDQCDLNDPDTLTYHLKVILPPDNKPIVDTDLTVDPFEIVIDGGEKKIFDKWTFHVTGKDVVDNDLVTVKIVGDGFDPADYGMSMPKTSAVGTVSSTFNWDLQCGMFNLAERDSFNIGFIAIDSTGKCRVRYLDSLVVKVKVLPPDNSPPLLSMLNLSVDVEFDGDTAVVWPGQKLELQLNVTDTDSAPKDQLSVQLVDMGGDDIPEGWEFNGATGPSVLTALFSWPPDCSIFKNNVFEHDFYFDFQFADDRCLTAMVDTVRVNVKVKDRESGTFLMDPANVFTPNGDEINDFYSMERRDESNNLVNILPPDNCQGVFENIKIYNRWGRAVFTSTNRDFRWYGLNESAGVYFYHVVFTNREFKGTVSLRD